jgi:protein SCO1/2
MNTFCCAMTMCVLAASAAAAPSRAVDLLPAEFDGVGIVQRLNETVPGDLVFMDHTGSAVQIKDLLAGGERPVILSLNYYRCPQLCKLTLNGLVESLADVDFTLGDDFDIVTVSIDPRESVDLAAQNRKGYMASLQNHGVKFTDNAWPFLVGKQAQIEQLADGVGFGYRLDEASGEYAHTSSIMFITPDGRISKYMNDVRFPSRDVHFALVEASQGRIGSFIDQILLFNCFQWDPDANGYVADAWKLMRLGGVFILLLIVIGWFVLWRMGSHEDGGSDDGHATVPEKEVLP